MVRKLLSSIVIATVVSAVAIGTSQVSAQGVDNFTVRSFTADYYLSKDNKNRSELKVVERVIAEFPQSDQNHGILRAIPEEYDGHTVGLDILGVTNQNGQDWNYGTSSENKNTVLKIGDGDKFVHGLQTYNIEYQLRDVTKNFTPNDEFFWNINGTQWQQPFEQVTARIHLAPGVAARFNEQTRCYTGVQDSTESACNVSVDGNTVTFSTTRALTSGENMSVVLGFQPGTFEPYRQDSWQLALLVASALVGLVGIPTAAFVIMWRKWRAQGSDPKGRGTIIPRYTPPEGINPILADIVINERAETKAISATALELCIKRYLKLYEIKKDKLIGSKTEYELELVKDPSSLSTEEQKVLDVLFSGNPSVGDKVNLSQQKNKLYGKVASLQKSANSAVAKQGYFTTNPSDARKKYLGWGIGLLVVGGSLVFAIPIMLLGIGLLAAGVIVLIFSGVMPARTKKGVETKEHLLGLRDYMTIAESDRIKVLESPKGAEKTPVDPDDKAQLVKLYEKLLPYAVLFGIEKQWAKQFADMYEQPPDWYSGSRSFNTGVFVGAISGFNTASTSSFTAPSSSSSSGFSGGSSGGGGGGGGGGGW
jgi:uncharacterized membrane protein YgcG